jgi:hypothetical protein
MGAAAIWWPLIRAQFHRLAVKGGIDATKKETS